MDDDGYHIPHGNPLGEAEEPMWCWCYEVRLGVVEEGPLVEDAAAAMLTETPAADVEVVAEAVDGMVEMHERRSGCHCAGRSVEGFGRTSGGCGRSWVVVDEVVMDAFLRPLSWRPRGYAGSRSFRAECRGSREFTFHESADAGVVCKRFYSPLAHAQARLSRCQISYQTINK